MQIRVGYELIYESVVPTPMILTLNIHESRVSDIVSRDQLVTTPALPIRAYRDSFGNWCTRVLAPGGDIRLSADALISDSGAPDIVDRGAPQIPVDALPEEVLLY